VNVSCDAAALAYRGVVKVKIYSRHEIQELLTMDEALTVVEHAFVRQAEGKTAMPPKVYLDIPGGHGDFRAMPAYIDGIAGIKWVSVYPDNSRYNLPTVLATIILSDHQTGQLLAVMDGSYITEIRTGAAGGVAVKYLARKDSTSVGMLGAGVQAETQLLAIKKVLPELKEVKVFDLNADASHAYAAKMSRRLGVSVEVAGSIEAMSCADIIVTTTPSRRPIVEKGPIRPGTHLNAIGADAQGKQELSPELLLGAKIVVDDIEQASHSGEINVPLSQGKLQIGDIYGTLGEVITGGKRGRANDGEITVFDSTGLAIQDIACAKLVYDKVKSGKAQAVGSHA
jgi:alanine dehydrogenase